jgi:hypothetical protein
VMRGHFGRNVFRARCNDVLQELVVAEGGNTDDDVVAETPSSTQVSTSAHDAASAPAWGTNDFIDEMHALYRTRVRALVFFTTFFLYSHSNSSKPSAFTMQ